MGQWISHALDRFLHGKRLRVVAAARDVLMAPEAPDATAVVGAPLPINPDAAATLKRRLLSGSGAARAVRPLTLPRNRSRKQALLPQHDLGAFADAIFTASVNECLGAVRSGCRGGNSDGRSCGGAATELGP